MLNTSLSIRSFARHQGRVTPGQKKGLALGWAQWGVDWSPEDGPLEMQGLFLKDQPLTLEIGFGMGDSFLHMARAHPQRNFIGLEIYKPGLGRCLSQLLQMPLSNVKILQVDAKALFHFGLTDGLLDQVNLFFPDPWPKKKHHKRRLVQRLFCEQVARCIKPKGIFHLATDWGCYYAHMHEVLEACEDFHCMSVDQNAQTRPLDRQASKFERRAHRLGHAIWDLVYQRKA